MAENNEKQGTKLHSDPNGGMNTQILPVHIAMESRKWDLMVQRLAEFLKETKEEKLKERRF